MKNNKKSKKIILSKIGKKMHLECSLLGLTPLLGVIVGFLIYIFMRYGAS